MNPVLEVTKVFTFDSAHNLKEYKGKCERLHGHTYRLEVTVKGKKDEEGMVIDFSDLKTIVKSKIIDKLDHAYLNDVLGFNTTCENMLTWIWRTLSEHLDCERFWLQKLVLWETPTSYVSLSREDIG